MDEAAAGAPFWSLAILALVQGITEFLPISSSAHLILVPVFVGWSDQGLAIDVAMHIGSLAAVVLYFRRDVARLVRGGVELVRGRGGEDARLAGQIVLATIPVVVAGFLLRNPIAHDWRSPMLIAATTAGFALALWAADRRADGKTGSLLTLTWGMALVIGLMQALALVPGVSRSGITMTAALFLGLSRTESARFSLLLSIPTTAAAGVLGSTQLLTSGDLAQQGEAMIAALLAFVSALGAIGILMAWLRRATFLPFVVYRLVLAGVLVGFIAGGEI